jgi:hypothetical protein
VRQLTAVGWVSVKAILNEPTCLLLSQMSSSHIPVALPVSSQPP